MGDTSKHVPNVEWLLECLAILNPSHRFFDVDYVPPPVERKKK